MRWNTRGSRTSRGGPNRNQRSRCPMGGVCDGRKELSRRRGRLQGCGSELRTARSADTVHPRRRVFVPPAMKRHPWLAACLLLAIGCQKKVESPTPKLTATSTPPMSNGALVCNVQLTTTVELTGEGLTPLVRRAI